MIFILCWRMVLEITSILGARKGKVANPVIPFNRKALLYHKPLLPSQVTFYLHLIDHHFATWSLTYKECWGSKLAFPSSLEKGDKRKGVEKLLWVSQPTVPAIDTSHPVYPHESIISWKFIDRCSFHHLLVVYIPNLFPRKEYGTYSKFWMTMTTLVFIC